MQPDLRAHRRRTRRIKRRIFTALLLLAMAVISYFSFNRETKQLDDRARKSVSGNHIHLQDGTVHYEITGPENGQPIVLIHGGSIPYFVWDRNAPALAGSGFRTIRYDLYGRGTSDRPDTVYDRDLYNRQLLSLLDSLQIKDGVHLVGLSMGGAVAASFADRYPDRVDKLCLIDPVGFATKLPAITKLMYVPGLGEYLFRIIGRFMLSESFVRSDFFDPTACPDSFLAAYEDQMKYEGFQRALLSTLRHMPLDDMTDVYRRVGRTARPILIVWGKEDRTTPFAASEQAIQAMPRASLHPIEKAGHLAAFERAEVVNPLLIEFLKE